MHKEKASLSVDDITLPSGDEVMPMHHHLGVHFFPHSGDGLRSVVANLSTAGFQVRFPVEEMENTNSTPWRSFWDRESCVEKREKQKMDDYFEVCPKGARVIWTPFHKLAYIKTAKAGSTAFYDFFEKHFSDAEEISPFHLPDDAYVFTFTRDPFEQKLAAFAEIDLKQEAGEETVLSSRTTFQHVPRSEDFGRSRFAAFLDDIWMRRFQPEDGRSPAHAMNQVGHAVCIHRMDFIGHLEHLTADWEKIQAAAGLPLELRTTALPVVHAAVSDPVYTFDENVPLTEGLREKICEIYRSEFACLGYEAPAYCQKYVLP